MTNQDQIDYWNGDAGATWVHQADTFDTMFADVGNQMLALAALTPGETILDIGCGAGATSFLAQQQVGDKGQVTGIDVSVPLVMLARERAQKRGSRAQFVADDAATWSSDSKFDVIISRFGIMFFENPENAFTHLRRQTKAGGRLIFSCWRRAEESEFVTLPMDVMAPLLAEPTIKDKAKPDPTAPGPHAFGDKTRIHSILTTAGWHDINIDPWDGKIQLPGDTPAQGAAFIAGMGSPARLIREKKINKDRLLTALTQALAKRMENGKTLLKSPAWFVTARH